MKTKILAIAGSLRSASLSRALVREAIELAPEGVTILTYELADIPLYNGDVDVDGGPEAVRRFKEAIGSADGLLIATPEYNYGIPGVLKNAIDWASRPGFKSVLARKPVAVMGVANGTAGAARALGQLKQVLLATLSLLYPAPELTLGSASSKFAEGRLTDDKDRQKLARLLGEFSSFIDQTRPR